MDSSTSAAPALNNAKLAQLNLLLDKAKLFSQFIGQSVQQTTENLYSGTESVSDAVALEGYSDTRKAKATAAKDKSKTMTAAMSAFDNKVAEKKKKLAQPPLVTGGTLRSYQEEGLNWLIQLYENGINGILADEMGLGKTVMTISFLAHLWWKGVAGPFLIVSPSSTLDNWLNEFIHWAPTMPVIKYHGTKEERQKIQEDLIAINIANRKIRKLSASEATKSRAQLKRMPTIITSYEIAIRDRPFLEKFNWKYLVVDEAHRLKNFNSKLIRELQALKTENRLLLTGTPLQNNLSELWSLLNFVLPDIFDNLDNFQSWFDFDEIVDSSENRREMEEKIGTELVEKLHMILQPFLLRRLKSEIPDLFIPAKRQVIIYAPFAEPQRVFYDLIKLRDFHSILAKGHKIRVMNILMQLRKVCNHPFLFDEIYDTFYKEWKKTPNLAELTARMEERSEPKLAPRKRAGPITDTAMDIDSDSDNDDEDHKDDDESAHPESDSDDEDFVGRRTPSRRKASAGEEAPIRKRHGIRRAASERKTVIEGEFDIFGLSDSDESEIQRISCKKRSPESSAVAPSPAAGKASGAKRTSSTAKSNSSPASASSTKKASAAQKRKRVILDDEDDQDAGPTQVQVASDDSDGEDEDALSEAEKTKRLEEIAKSNPIKRSQTAFMLFCAKKRQQIGKKGLKFSMDFQREWAAEWRALSVEQKQQYEEQASDDRIRYLKAIEEQWKEVRPDIMIHDPQQYLQSLVNSCGKMQLLERMLPELRAKGHKVLIFSQFTRMLDILEDYLDYSGYQYCRLDGSVAQKERQVQIDRFNKDPEVFAFLLSTRAGGLGINLTSADTVIIYDSDWNPQMDLQAQDRCHRIGQTKPVVVFRLITANSIESNILRRASNKLKLERLIIHKDRFAGERRRLVSETEMLEILKDDDADGVLGDEKTITEIELIKMLDRETCMKMFDSQPRPAAAAACSSNEAATRSSTSLTATTTSSGLLPPIHEGYELIEEGADGQGGLIV